MSYPPPRSDGNDGRVNATTAALSRGLTLTDEERAAFFSRHDTFWVNGR